jgi:hypothetical protein
MKKNKYLFFIASILIFIFFSWGFLTATYKIFPFSFIRDIYWTFVQEDIPYDKDKDRVDYINEFYQNEEFVAFQKSIIKDKFNNIKKNPNLFRNQIINDYILPSKIININELNIEEIVNKKIHIDARIHQFQEKPSPNSVLWNARYYNIDHYGILETNKDSKKLLVYIHGHNGNPYSYKYFLDIKEKFKNKGYDVMSLSMTGLGFNKLAESDHSFPVNTEKKSNISFDYRVHKRDIGLHDNYQFYYDKNYPNIKPLALMLSGNYYLIKNLENKYEEVTMMGLSGGGWYTTMLSALIPRIEKSYSFAGSLPKVFGLQKQTREWEEIFSPIWEKYDYWDFYFLALFDGDNFHSREHHLIFNNKDPSRFADPYASAFKNIVDLVSIDKLKAVVIENEYHNIDTQFVEEYILKD